LNRGFQIRLLAIKAFRDDYEATNQKKLTKKDWIDDIDDKMMDKFIMDGKVLPGAYGITPAVAPITTTPSNVHQRSTATIENFRKTIRRDPTHFNVFNDKRLWARWKLEFEATARAQDLNDILNPNYRPGTPDEKEIFDAKQQYLYAVFVRTLTTDEGKTLVRQHVSDYDAQNIYKSLSDFHSNSMHSELVGNEIMIFLTTFRYNVNHWAGKTAVSFITYFLEQL